MAALCGSRLKLHAADRLWWPKTHTVWYRSRKSAVRVGGSDLCLLTVPVSFSQVCEDSSDCFTVTQSMLLEKRAWYNKQNHSLKTEDRLPTPLFYAGHND